LGLDQNEEGKDGLDEQSCEIFDDLSDAKIVNEDDTADRQGVLASRKGLKFGRNGRWFSVSVNGEQHDGQTVADEMTCAFSAAKGE